MVNIIKLFCVYSLGNGLPAELRGIYDSDFGAKWAARTGENTTDDIEIEFGVESPTPGEYMLLKSTKSYKLNTDLREEAVNIARAEALAKLTPSEIKLLGLEPPPRQFPFTGTVE